MRALRELYTYTLTHTPAVFREHLYVMSAIRFLLLQGLMVLPEVASRAKSTPHRSYGLDELADIFLLLLNRAVVDIQLRVEVF